MSDVSRENAKTANEVANALLVTALITALLTWLFMFFSTPWMTFAIGLYVAAFVVAAAALKASAPRPARWSAGVLLLGSLGCAVGIAVTGPSLLRIVGLVLCGAYAAIIHGLFPKAPHSGPSSA